MALSLPFSTSIRLVVGFDGRGWRFFEWTDHLGQRLAAEPSSDDRGRYFEEPRRAQAFFRKRYGSARYRSSPRIQHRGRRTDRLAG